MTLLHVTGARPNFPKAAPVLAALAERGVRQRLVHTGQHYDDRMSEVFFRELDLPRPDLNLGVGSGSHAQQTAAILTGLEAEMIATQPELVVVYGDVNSTLAAAIAASKLQIPVAHVEAGLRSFDMTMPEEINRIVTDRLSDLLLCTSPEAIAHLAHEGVSAERIYLVGNPMIDTLLQHVPYKKGVLAGNSIWQDRRFLLRHMPTFESMLHYRQIDVSTIKVLSKQWYGESGNAPGKPSMHTALDDIRASISELRWYRQNIFSVAAGSTPVAGRGA